MEASELLHFTGDKKLQTTRQPDVLIGGQERSRFAMENPRGNALEITVQTVTRHNFSAVVNTKPALEQEDIGQDEETGRWSIIRFMIGADHQGRGYGTAALRGLIDLMVERRGCREIFLGYVPGNALAERLYARMGFVPTGEIEAGDNIACLDVG